MESDLKDILSKLEDKFELNELIKYVPPNNQNDHKSGNLLVSHLPEHLSNFSQRISNSVLSGGKKRKRHKNKRTVKGRNNEKKKKTKIKRS